MANYSKRNKVSEQTQADALAVARATQKPGQSKEQTKLIAQGIQKGINAYKKQQKAKSRELDKRLKSVARSNDQNTAAADNVVEKPPLSEQRLLPWALLVLSWAAFAFYIWITNY